MKILLFLKRHKLMVWISFFIFTSLSLLLQHFTFGTNAYDLGIEAGTARNIVFKHSFFDPVMNINLLGDHFEPLLALPGILFHLWDNAAVTILFQNICVFLSIFLAYFLAKHLLNNELKALLLTTIFTLCYYLQAANRFPFHIEMLAMPLFFILLILIETKRNRRTFIFIVLVSLIMCFIKEDIPLTVGFFGLWVLIFKRDKRLEGLLMFLIGISAFFVITVYLMPHFSNGVYTHLGRYSNLGNTPAEIIKTLLRPDKVISNLITPSEKITQFLLLFAWFLFLPFFAPGYILAGFSPLFYNMISNFRSQYMFDFQYSISLLPFLFYGSIYGMKNLKLLFYKLKNKVKMVNIFKKICYLYICVVLIAGISVNFKYFNPLTHWRNLSLYTVLSQEIKPIIPIQSRIITIGELQPHFIEYDYATMLDPHTNLTEVKNNTYFILLNDRIPWPWDEVKYKEYISKLREQSLVLFEKNSFLVMKSKT